MYFSVISTTEVQKHKWDWCQPSGPAVWTSFVRRRRCSPGEFSSGLLQPAEIFLAPGEIKVKKKASDKLSYNEKHLNINVFPLHDRFFMVRTWGFWGCNSSQINKTDRTTYQHGADSRGVGGTGKPQVRLGDVLTGAHNGAILPTEGLLCSIR